MTREPLISVIVAVYNGEAYLAQAIDSILAQGWKPIELIVVDDGSSDGTAEIAQSYGNKILYHRLEHIGQGAARNAGIALAKGELLAFLDADDLWTADKLKLQMAWLMEHPDVDMVFGLMEIFHSPELSDARKNELKGHGQVMAGYSICTLLIWKKSFMRLKPFSTELTVGEFMEWFLRAKEAEMRYGLVDQVVMKRRLHNANIGIQRKDQRHEYLKVLKESLNRRRRK